MSGQASAGAPVNDALIASDITGRLRIRLRREMRSESGMASLAHGLRSRVGISQVDANSRTGSVTVQYDAQTHTRDGIIAMLRDLGVIVGAVTGSATLGASQNGRSLTGDQIAQAFDDLDGRISDATGMRLDLKVLFPLSLFGIGVWRTAVAGLGLSQVPAYVMFWYAFSSFMTLNAPERPPDEHG